MRTYSIPTTYNRKKGAVYIYRTVLLIYTCLSEVNLYGTRANEKLERLHVCTKETQTNENVYGDNST